MEKRKGKDKEGGIRKEQVLYYNFQTIHVTLFARVALQRTRLRRRSALFLQMNKSRIQNRRKIHADPLKTRREVSRHALMSKRVTTVYAEARNAHRQCYTSKYKVRHYASF